MTRYRKSIHQTLQEVAEWEAPKEPEVIVEEAPIPTETGRELLKKRIAHRKIEKKELKYYPMGDVFRGKLHKTTQYLKEALEIDDELDEAVKWEVKVTGLPVFYSDGKSKGAVRQMLRKLLKHPDDIQSITRTTSAELKKIRRGQIAGDEPGDEDEDKNPVGPSYNEEFVDEMKPKRVAAGLCLYDHKEPPRKLKITQQGLEAFKQSRDAIKDEEVDETLDLKKIRAQRKVKAAGRMKDIKKVFSKKTKPTKDMKVEPRHDDPDRGYFEDVEDAYDYKAKKGAIAAPGSGSIAKAKKAKASDVTKSIEQQMADARKESVEFKEGEWDQMWKNAAHSKPKMSFKQAIEFVDEVGLDKKEKKNALKTAKKWLR